MRKLAVILLAIGTALAFGAIIAAGAGAKPPVVEHHPTTICHRTNSVTNPYVQITVDDDSVDADTNNQNGDDHFGEHKGPIFDPANPPPPPHNGDQWGDVIPPTADDGFPLGHAGLNWTAEGQALLANGCEFPPTSTTTTTPVETTTTTTPVTTTTTTPVTTTTTTTTTQPPRSTTTTAPPSATTTTTTPATVSPSTSSAPPNPPNKPPNKPPANVNPTTGTAFTGPQNVVPLGILAAFMLLLGVTAYMRGRAFRRGVLHRDN